MNARLTKPLNRTAVLTAALPGALLLALFYTLAIHMYASFGGWPDGIGERGFPPALLLHCNVTVQVASALLLSLLASAVPIILCLLVPRWRGLAIYLFIFAGVLSLCFFLTASPLLPLP